LGFQRKKIVIATNNQGKMRELQACFDGFQVEIITQREAGISPVEETGDSFLANAMQKARHAATYSEYPTVADDSGLIVDRLNGRPGVYSARYAGSDSSDEENIDFLLKEMEGENERKARFHCCLIYIRSPQDRDPIIVTAEWNGVICHRRLGKKGFGYDPIFFVPELKLTAAELTIDVKNKYSHRGKANKMLVKKLLNKNLIQKI